MKYATDRPYSDPEKAARRILEIANSVEAIQDGRIYIEKLNSPFLFGDKGTPATKLKGGTVSEPEEAASPRATSSRNGGRDHLGMAGEIKSERWARSFRNGGRHRAESAAIRQAIFLAAELSKAGEFCRSNLILVVDENGQRIFECQAS